MDELFESINRRKRRFLIDGIGNVEDIIKLFSHLLEKELVGARDVVNAGLP